MKSPCVMDNWTFKTDQLMNNPNYLARDTPNKQPWVACLVYLGGTCLAGVLGWYMPGVLGWYMPGVLGWYMPGVLG